MKRVVRRLVYVTLFLGLLGCSTLNPSSSEPANSNTTKAAVSYRNLNLQEASFMVSGSPAQIALLGDTTIIDGEVWVGRHGQAVALRSGRITLLETHSANSFTAYALTDPIDSWLGPQGKAILPAPAANAVTYRIIEDGNQTIVETRRLEEIEQSIGADCKGYSNGPCWVIHETVEFSSHKQPRKATTYVDAIFQQVVYVNQPLPDGYLAFEWKRVR